MPAPIVLAHDDRNYVATTSAVLTEAGYEVASFTDSFAALKALEAAETAELLIVRVQMPLGMPTGFPLALLAKQRPKGIKLLFLADPGLAHIVAIEGCVLTTATPPPSELLAAVKGLLAKQEN